RPRLNLEGVRENMAEPSSTSAITVYQGAQLAQYAERQIRELTGLQPGTYNPVFPIAREFLILPHHVPEVHMVQAEWVDGKYGRIESSDVYKQGNGLALLRRM